MTTSENIGKRIRNIRHQKGMSQEQLALNANMNTSYLGQLERGTKNPTLPTLEKIARGLNIQVDELISEQIQQQSQPITNLSLLTLLTRDEIKKLVIEAINENCKQAIHFKSK